MAINIAVLKETRPGERRVTLVPNVVSKFTKLGARLRMQSGAGKAIMLPDELFEGVSFVDDPRALVGDADMVLAVQPPGLEIASAMRSGAVLIAFIYGHKEPALVRALRDGQITCFAMDLVPRSSRAQAMDALSSQAALGGYYAVLLGATKLDRILPMMTTAVGALRPATVLVMGLGVAGLQAAATAHRLGAVVEAYDVRPETREEAGSVGAKFIDAGVDARGEGGYARELTPQEQQRTAEVLTQHIQRADLVITTAALPGRPSPKLISRAQVEGMKPGAVIVDLAGEGGGNCECTRPDEEVHVGQVTIMAPTNIPSLLGEHASELYAKNVLNLLQLMIKDGSIQIDWADDILANSVLTHAGVIKNEAVRKLVETDQDVIKQPAALGTGVKTSV
jgi:proton-translocating NAD(P)+ transhydrogenase subunit alpha